MFFPSGLPWRKSCAKPRPGALPRRRTVRLRLEPLEDRSLPSTYLVTNLNDSGTGSLRAAVTAADANPGSTIDFAHGLHGTIRLTSGELDITSSMTINGPGANRLAVSGNHSSRIFNVSGSKTDATISGLTITDGRASEQAGGILNQDSTLNLSGDVLSDNVVVGSAASVRGRGGAIRNLTGNLNITGSRITDNQALGGTGLFGEGGGIDNLSGQVTINNSILSGNLARGANNNGTSGEGEGGAINNRAGGLFTLTGSLVIDNQAIGGNGGGNGTGGAIDNFGSLVVSNSTFLNNKAIAGNGGTGPFVGDASGGAINTAGTLDNAIGSTSISGCTFDHNQAIGGSDGNSDLTFASPFVDYAFGGGVAASFGVTIQITNSSFIHNQAIGGNNSTATETDIIGVGGAEGGAFYSEVGDAATLSRCTFDHNQAIGGNGNTGSGTGSNAVVLVGEGLGGAIVSGYGSDTEGPNTLTVSNCTFTHNEAVGGDNNTGTASVSGLVGTGTGAAIANYAGGSANVSGSRFDHNQAKGGDGNTAGGAAAVFANLGAGGAIFNYLGGYNSSVYGQFPTSIVTVSNSTLSHNDATGGRKGDGLGGGLANLVDAQATVQHSIVSDNVAKGGDEGGNGFGGGFYNDATSTLTIQNSTVTGNHANAGDDGEGIGGGVYNLGTLNMIATFLKHNHATTSHDDLFG